MELKEIKKLRDQLEQTIFNVAADFEEQTDVKLSNVIYLTRIGNFEDGKKVDPGEVDKLKGVQCDILIASLKD